MPNARGRWPKLEIAETFYSIQGEGGLAGLPFVFVRLAGCTLACEFCDTNHAGNEFMEPIDLLIRLHGMTPCSRLLWTGGEPLLQLSEGIIAFFHDAGYTQAVETNGTLPVPPGLDYVSVSPKLVDENGQTARSAKDGAWTIEAFASGKADEARVCVPELGWLRRNSPLPKFNADRLILSPNTETDEFEAIMKECVAFCLENPAWSLSVQQHKKLWKIS